MILLLVSPINFIFGFISTPYSDMSQQKFVGLQHVFSVTILRLPRRLEDVLKMSCKDVLKTFWKTKNCYAEDVFKTSWRQTCLLVISVSKKSRCVSNKSMFRKSLSDKSKANPKCVTQNPIISIFLLF